MFFTGQYALSTPMFQRIIPIIFLRLAEKASKKEEKKQMKNNRRKKQQQIQQMNGKTFTFRMSSDLFLELSFSNYRVTKYVYFEYRLFNIFSPLTLSIVLLLTVKKDCEAAFISPGYIQNVYVTLQVLDKSACVIADKRPTL